MDPIDFMQQVALRASELQSAIPKGESREWKLGFKMLHNPKLHCPFCEEWIASGRVWVVDEDSYTVKRVWKLDGTKIHVDGCHPHVGSGGRICMGNARSASDALIAGIAGRDDFIRAWDWFPRELGHTCENMDRARECGRFDRHADDPFEDDHDGERYCESCDYYYDEDGMYFCDHSDRVYCPDCWHDSHNDCEDCDGDIHTHADESSYEVEGRYGTKQVCESCYTDNYFTCALCDGGFRNDKHQKDGVCVSCWAETHSDCENCSQEFDKSELSESPDGEWLCPACEQDRLDKVMAECEEEASDGE